MSLFRHLSHLVVRFFSVLRTKPLSPQEQADVNRVLSPAEAKLFFGQQVMDQRHSIDVAAGVHMHLPGDDDAIAAALLHDVGKRHSRLGAIGRSLATVADTARLPLPRAWRLYRDHGDLGAHDLSAVGARPLAVAFASGMPYGDAAVWRVLVAADDGRLAASPKAPGSIGAGNTMPPEVNA